MTLAVANAEALAPDALAVCERELQVHSKSFALASKLFDERARGHAAVVYAWCRRADDAIDLAPPDQQHRALAALRAEHAAIFSGQPLADPVLSAFAEVARQCNIPASYSAELLDGMEMDVTGQRYASLDELLLYCHRVAGTVGLMMCHVMGIKDDRALAQAAHLGIAMQLTNICRDVYEDWQRDRLYVPDELLTDHGAAGLRQLLGTPLPSTARVPLARCVERLLFEADTYYRSGDEGLRALGWRPALAVRTARLVYADIGRAIARQGYDVFAGRAVVTKPRKLWLIAHAMLSTLAEAPARLVAHRALHLPNTTIRFPDDVLPV